MPKRFGLTISAASLLVRVAVGESSVGPEFPFQSHDGLIWVQVRAQESDQPLNFLLDSGAGVSVINQPIAEKLGLKRGAAVSVQGVRSHAKGYWTQPLSAVSGSIPLPKNFIAVDLGELSRACQCRVDGLLGADFFSNRVVQIDFAASKVRLLAAAPISAGGMEVPLNKNHGALLVPITVNGSDTNWVRLDTGCANALHWVTPGARSKSLDHQMSVALTRLSVPQTRTTVELGGVRFDGVTTSLHEKQIFSGEAGLLGVGLLSRFNSVILDASAGRIIFQGRPSEDTTSSELN